MELKKKFSKIFKNLTKFENFYLRIGNDTGIDYRGHHWKDQLKWLLLILKLTFEKTKIYLLNSADRLKQWTIIIFTLFFKYSDHLFRGTLYNIIIILL